MGWLGEAFGPGWLGNLVVSVVTLAIGGLVGWFARRPLEKAGILEAVNKRIDAHMKHLEAEVQRITDQHQRCEERLDALEEERRRDRAEIDQLRGQLAQEKQVASSLKRSRETNGEGGGA